jgi:DnaD/phage-associated family protein
MNEKSAKASKSAQARWKKNEVEKVEVEELPVDDGLKKVSKYVQHNGFGMLNSKIANEIIEYLDDGIEPDLIIQAINIAIDNNARNWGYCKACIDKWLDKGIKTVEQYNAEDIKYKAEKQSKQRYSVPQKQSILERLGGVDHEQDGNVQAICCD